MQELIQSLDGCVTTGNWYGALFVALILPDICGKIDQPTETSSRLRYADWFDRYIRPKYTHRIGADRQEHVFLGGSDCYALRCAFLHEGVDDTSKQSAKRVIDKFHFIVAPKGRVIHCNMFKTKLQLQVNIFCEDIKQGVLAWLRDIAGDPNKMASAQSLLKIQFPNQNGSIRI